MKRCFLMLAGMALLGAGPGSARGDIIWDVSPKTTGAHVDNDSWGNDWGNPNQGQTFADTFAFGSAMQITGMDIYDYVYDGKLGDAAIIRLWADANGRPGAMLAKLFETVSAADTVGAVAYEHRLHVDFTSPLLVDGGTTYWIGMASWHSPTQHWDPFTQTTLDGVDDSRLAEFEGDKFLFIQSIGDMAFRLGGGPAVSTPEPASLTLLSLGCAGLAVYCWRRRKAAAS